MWVSTRLRPEFAGRWLWRTMRESMRDLPERSPFEPERVRWLLLELLGQLPDRPEFELVRQRVRTEGSLARLSFASSVTWVARIISSTAAVFGPNGLMTPERNRGPNLLS